MKWVLAALCVVCAYTLSVEAGVTIIKTHYTSGYPKIRTRYISTPILLSHIIHKKISLPPTTITIHNKYAVPVAKPYPVPFIKHVAVPAPYRVPIHVDKPYPVRIPKPVPVFVDKPVPITVERPYHVPIVHKVAVPEFKDFEIPVFKPTPFFDGFPFDSSLELPAGFEGFGLPPAETGTSSESSDGEIPAVETTEEKAAEIKEEPKAAEVTSESSQESSN